MGGNTFGTLFRVTTFGESHGPAAGCVVDGCPAGLSLDIGDIRRDLARRRPGSGLASTSRSEADEPEILSGLFEGKTLGTPIAIVVRNADQRSADYDNLKDLYRPGHADWPWEAKYGHRDHRGGGRTSARETVGRVAAGAVARVFLKTFGVEIRAWTSAAAGINAPAPGSPSFDWDEIENNPLRMPDKNAAREALKEIERLKNSGDSAGSAAAAAIWNLPPGLGEPVFDKLDARIAAAMLSLGAAKAVEFGAGSAAKSARGSILNDAPLPFPPGGTPPAWVTTLPPQTPPAAWKTNHAGGILGGLSTGGELNFTVTFKPISSIALPQETLNRRGEKAELTVRGRHDICVAPRAVPVVEAMCALVLADFFLLGKSSRM